MRFRQSLRTGRKALTTVAFATLAAMVSGDEGHGDDHGDTYLSSTRIEYGVTMSGELDAGDVDVFRFDLQGRADVEVRGSGQLDTVAELLDSEGEVIGEDDDSGPNFNFGFREILEGGVYYVRVSSDVGDTGTHRITAYIVREDDHGDTSGNSSVLPLGVRATARIAPATDRDVFRVEVEREGQLRVWTEGPTNTMGELRDSADMIVESADGGGDRGNFSIVHSVEPGVFYMHVTADAVGTYFPLAEMGEFEDVDDDHGHDESGAGDGDEDGVPLDDAITFFKDHISAPIVQAKCVNCHVQGGVSGNTHLVFVRAAEPDERNINAFIDLIVHKFAEGEADPVGFVMTKVTGGNMHGGGMQIAAGSTDYTNLETFLEMLLALDE